MLKKREYRGILIHGEYTNSNSFDGLKYERASGDSYFATCISGSPKKPITATDTGTSATFTFPNAGIFPYHCATHDSSGMNGVIKVMP